MSKPPTLLVLAGHDPTGGAGVDADREAAQAQGVGVHCIVTAWTAQDGRVLSSIGARDPEEWFEEARRVALRERPALVKTGLLPGAGHLRAAARLIAEFELPAVVDPVIAASGGEVFLDESAVDTLIADLLPCTTHLTPNLQELSVLARAPLEELAEDLDLRVEAARSLLEHGVGSVLLKGGHGQEDPVCDLLLEAGASPRWHEHPRIEGSSLHGSGCRHASCVAACLARGLPAEAALARAGDYLLGLLRASGAGGK